MVRTTKATIKKRAGGFFMVADRERLKRVLDEAEQAMQEVWDTFLNKWDPTGIKRKKTEEECKEWSKEYWKMQKEEQRLNKSLEASPESEEEK
jgi:hypothetical protein